MALIGKWNGHEFTVTPKLIRGFTDLSITGSSETEDKKSGSEAYVSRKNGKPLVITFTVNLSALTGCDVRSEAIAFTNNARTGKSDYFYVGGSKLVGPKLMLTEAKTEDVQMNSEGKWISANVKLTMKQCTKYDSTTGSSGSSSSSSSGGGGSSSSKKTSVKKTTAASAIAAVTSAVGAVAGVVGKVVGTVASLVSTAKKVSTVKKTVAPVKKVDKIVKKVTPVKKVSFFVKKK